MDAIYIYFAVKNIFNGSWKMILFVETQSRTKKKLLLTEVSYSNDKYDVKLISLHLRVSNLGWLPNNHMIDS